MVLRTSKQYSIPHLHLAERYAKKHCKVVKNREYATGIKHKNRTNHYKQNISLAAY